MILPIIIGTITFWLVGKNRNSNIDDYDITNKVFHYAMYIPGSKYSQTYVFEKDGTYYNFSNEYDEDSTLRVVKGTWKRNEAGMVDINYELGIFYEGGHIVNTDEHDYFNMRRVDYVLEKRVFKGITSVKYSHMHGEKDEKYQDYIYINDNVYYPIYEFESKTDLYKKLEEMYGEKFKLLVADNVKAIE